MKKVTYKRTHEVYDTCGGQHVDRIEFLLINWDNIDGGDYIAKIFCEEFGMVKEPKFDGIWLSKLKIHDDNVTYVFFWYEDFGNSVYPLKQDEETLNLLEERLKIALKILNERIASAEK